MAVGEKDMGLSLRISGRFYSADSVIDKVHAGFLSPSQMSKVGANFLTVLLVLCMNLLGYNQVVVGWVIAALFVHAFGHYLGMIVTRSETASYTIGIFGPLAIGAEGLAAGRKALVALSGSIAGLAFSAALFVINSALDNAALLHFANAVIFVSALNLLPIKPFDGYAVVDHLVFLRHPKIELAYLILAGLFVFGIFIRSLDVDKHALYSLFFMALLGCMFGGAKKADNMADMVVRLRKEGVVDYRLGRYRLQTVKRMEFSLNLFDVENEEHLAGLLREVWDHAWEEPATLPEMIIVLAMYVLMLICFMSMPIIEQICSTAF
ncbi:hypothetical protein P4C99_12280 [Pontiellaceae bacterium B1224]|nr:hypothetical protein [Pontiellaceae bacterium B1224]